MINRRNLLQYFGIGAAATTVPIVALAETPLDHVPAKDHPSGPSVLVKPTVNERIEELGQRLLYDAQKELDITTIHISYVICDSEFEKSDDDIANRYFEPACRELKESAIALRSKVTTIRVETETGVTTNISGEPGVRMTVFADLQCPWSREFDREAWRELESNQLRLWVLYEDGSMLPIPAFRQGKSIMAPYEGKDAVIRNVIAVQTGPAQGVDDLEYFGEKQTLSVEDGTFTLKSEPFLGKYSRKVSHGDMLMVKTA